MQIESALSEVLDTYHSPLETQIALEDLGRGLGYEKYFSAYRKRMEKGDVAATAGGRSLIDSSVHQAGEALRDYIERHLEYSKPGRPPKAHTIANLLAPHDPFGIVGVAMRRLLNYLSVSPMHGKPAVKVAERLGEDIDDIFRVTYLKKENTAFFSSVAQRLKDEGATAPHIRRAITAAMRKKGIIYGGMDKNESICLGYFLLSLLVRTTGILTLTLERVAKGKTGYVLNLAPGVWEWLAQIEEEGAVGEFVKLPFVIPPVTWSDPEDGIYHSTEVTGRSVVKMGSRGYFREFRARSPEVVYSCLNTLQEVPFKIDSFTLSTVNDLWNAGGKVIGLPSKEHLEDIPTPPDIDTNEDALRKWKDAQKKVYAENAQSVSKRVACDSAIGIARAFKERDIYFPYTLDSRGRVYADNCGLMPQGSDIQKGLMLFSERLPVSTDEDVFWFSVGLANCWENGIEKLPFDDRVQWVEKHKQDILNTASDPLGYTWWQQAESPVKFLAGCGEFAGLMSDGLGFETGFPVGLDAPCSGLQHFSAMLLDPVGARYTNLLPGDRPYDIYQVFADALNERLEELAKESREVLEWKTEKVPEAFIARQWLKSGIDRSFVKKQVMTISYGSTKQNHYQTYLQDISEKINKGTLPKDYFGKGLTSSACLWLNEVSWGCFENVVSAAMRVLELLRGVAKVAAKDDLPITWTTPCGFPVRHAYYKRQAKRVDVTDFESVRIRCVVATHTNKIDSNKSANALSPNIIHSYDASVLMTTCWTLRNNYGVKSIRPNHDEFAVHPCNCRALQTSYAEALIDHYTNHDPLVDVFKTLRSQLPEELKDKLPELPEKGSLDLNLLRESPYILH